MNKNYLAIILLAILLFSFIAKADVPPDPGFERASIKLITETTEDLSDYRFFLDFFGDLRKVEIKSKGRTEVPWSGGGGVRYRGASFLAIPKKSLGSYEGKLNQEKSSNLAQAIKSKEISGVVILAQHYFSRDVPKGEIPAESYYRLIREDNTLKAETVTEEKPKTTSSKEPKTTSSQLIASDSRTGMIVGGILLTLAALAIGVFAFRKVLKKA